MAWIESHTVLIRHRKVTQLAKDLRLKPVYVLGHLHSLWHAVLEQQEDGDLTSWNDDLIADLAQFSGNAPQFVSLLQKHGWLDGKLIHDWLDYAGRYLDAKYRTSNPTLLKAIREKHQVAKEEKKDALEVSPSLVRPPNQPNLTKPKEEQKPATRNQVAYELFRSKYQSVTGKDYIPQYGKDLKLLKGIVTAINSPEQWEETLNRFFTDPFAEKSGFPFGLLISQINKYNPGEVYACR